MDRWAAPPVPPARCQQMLGTCAPAGTRPRGPPSGSGGSGPCFPFALSHWAWRGGRGLLPASPCPPPRVPSGLCVPSALRDSARVRTLINQRQARHRQQGPHSSAAPSASYIPLFPTDSDGKKTAYAAHKRDETKMKRIEAEKRGGIFPPETLE